MKKSGVKMNISKAIAETIKKATALNDKTRLRIVLAIFNTQILKMGNSLTLSQLEKMLQVDKHDIAYHLSVLREVGIIDKKEAEEEGKQRTYYQTTKDCDDILNRLGITENKIKDLSKELSIGA